MHIVTVLPPGRSQMKTLTRSPILEGDVECTSDLSGEGLSDPCLISAHSDLNSTSASVETRLRSIL